MINTKMGVMENASSIHEIIEILAQKSENGERIVCDVIRNSKNHNGKTMLCIHEDAGNDVSLFHLEVSEEGIFPYEFDDGVS